VVALDIGSSSVRATLYDERGRPVPSSEVRHMYRSGVGADGTSEADADALLRLAARSLTEALDGAGPRRAGRIAGVGLSTFWHGLVAADEEARVLTPIYLWGDTRSSRASERLRGRLDVEAIRQRTGCPIHSSYWPAKLAWLRRERPELWRGQVRWVSLGDLFFWRLFGRLGTSLSMASGTGLFLLDESGWDAELLSELRMPASRLPLVAEVEQGLLPRGRRSWPALAGVPWFHALGDGALANFGSGCVGPSRRALTIGTSAAMRVMHTSDPVSAVPEGLWRYRLDASRMVTGGALSSGGNLREWLVATLRVGDGELDGLGVRGMVPGSHGLTVLPHLAGERGPGYAAHAFGAIAGLRMSSTAEDIGRAGLEAVAIELARISRRLDEVGSVRARVVASGAAILRSPGWMQMIADAIGRPVAGGRAREASSRGAALYVLERLGLADPGRLDPGVGRVYRPRVASTTAFREVQRRQEALYKALVAERVLGL
jgi:gluconokinase